MKGNIWIVAVVAILCVVVWPAVNVGAGNAVATTSTTATLTVDAGDSDTLTPSPSAFAFRDNETVTVNGTTYDEGTDYAFDAQNGTVEWLDSPRTAADAGAEAAVAYSYDYHDETTTGVLQVLGGFGGVLGLLFLLVCLAALLVLTFGGSGF